MEARPPSALKLTITRGGGLAGISRQTELAADALPDDAAATLHDQVAGSEWLEQETREAPQVHPDELSYEVTVEDQGQTTTRRFTEQTLPESLRSLIAWVDARPERSQSIVRP